MATITHPINAEAVVEACPSPQERLAKFHERFWRYRGPLQFTARLILGGTDEAERAVEYCWLRTSCNPPRFEREGEFRSWLLRVLISEALALLLQRRMRVTDSRQSSPHTSYENPAPQRRND